MAVIKWRIFIPVSSAPSIQRSAGWFPGLFLATDFTGPGVATKRGRRQEPRTTPDRDPEADYLVCGFVALLPPSSFGSRFERGKTAKPSLVPLLHYHGVFFQGGVDQSSAVCVSAPKRRSNQYFVQGNRHS